LRISPQGYFHFNIPSGHLKLGHVLIFSPLGKITGRTESTTTEYLSWKISRLNEGTAMNFTPKALPFFNKKDRLAYFSVYGTLLLLTYLVV
jgi:hypothetical protein